VPKFGLLAKLNAATKHRARVNRIGFDFMFLLLGSKLSDWIEVERILR
jgi:hypothetical protein